MLLGTCAIRRNPTRSDAISTPAIKLVWTNNDRAATGTLMSLGTFRDNIPHSS